ncbi:Uncharacterised protein [Mycolicibacterium phlei]|jgi:hypothetical protein|uniref:Uncharacterized protein n=1 Tax=Mycolicibacterium phlei DSM 43239 = CCUG 21000 TaxID=1226750 RepID=A0A5N5V688_MYCPH|nr:hypothetical protein [Mycolicibacterium phlei]VEG10365.1 Uncharacterised protein [Mycobacteroides chelonae]AMO62261.1 hypothetical protein MPHLCCUG_03460 [Mycolicibacterium phlei]KAB7757404.1 hypothetical protein MPHL21000_07915 [Mycolicibacterium phlei DSM 43239 = CCUG 21000]KXW66301.1 hypothetical protein MPHL43239_08500 [Mycolicibacterium phlei DSM 43239 = CCUG 21000]KXW70312.1 hypothetical protein MPHL43072_19405 [Mycolicibacterium phlei DSM 43072]
MDLQRRLGEVLEEVLPVTREEDGAVTVNYDSTFASLRTVPVAEGLELVSLTQILAWDLPLDAKLRNAVAEHAHKTLLGTVSLTAKAAPKEIAAGAKRNSRKAADVLLRYNFPAAGLGDDALRTLILMVLATGAEVRRALVG